MRKCLPALAVLLVTAAFPGMLHAAATCSGSYIVIPDGRIEKVDLTIANDIQAMFRAKANRSYCIEAQSFAMTPSLTIPGIGSAFTCPTTMPAAWTVRSAEEPAGGYPENQRRYCGAPGTTSVVFRVATDVATTAALSVTDTTLFNPRWSTYGGYVTSWGLENTTSVAIDGLLSVDDGTTAYTYNLTIAAGATAFVSSSSTFNEGTIGSNKAGNALFIHNGPPGSILGDCYFMNPQGVLIPSSFEPVRQNQH